jgi:AAA+ ATPase superfamily predicted ATPase
MSITKLIGRTAESNFLNQAWKSKDPQFIAVYGRRRVGKTFLIREYFINKGTYFELVGLKDGNMQDQLLNFAESFAKTFYPNLKIQTPKSWREAFELLTQELNKLASHKKITIFLDELPWLATKRSDLMQSLDHFWNTNWSRRPNLKLIVCGSAASWMLDNLINAKGGLHNRLTHSLLLQPYNLSQTKAFLSSRGIKLNNKQVLDIYMITGGIPHYLKNIQKSKSAIQNINELCFTANGLLFNEFPRLFASLFEKSTLHLRIVREIAKKRYGISIQDLSKKIDIKTGGTLTHILNELTAAGFIQKFLPYGRKKRDQYYRIIDEYSFFYLTWIEPYKNQEIIDEQSNHWLLASQTTAWKSWAGYTFESICYKHINKIRHTLGLDHIHCHISNWRHLPKKLAAEDGAQIDLLIDRDDGIVNLCEIKFHQKKLIIDKTLARNLIKKMDIFEQVFPSEKQLSLTLITSAGIKENIWSEDLIDNHTTLNDLF